MEAINDTLDALEKAMEYSRRMLEERSIRRLEYEENILVMGPEYWVLYENMRKAEAAYEAAEEAVLDATKKANEAEVEYFTNLKCTFCGDLMSDCGGDHGDEMRDICRESERRY